MVVAHERNVAMYPHTKTKIVILVLKVYNKLNKVQFCTKIFF